MVERKRLRHKGQAKSAEYVAAAPLHLTGGDENPTGASGSWGVMFILAILGIQCSIVR